MEGQSLHVDFLDVLDILAVFFGQQYGVHSGTFGGDITGTGEFNIKAPDGWTLSGNHSFGAAVTLADGSLTVADGSMTFSDNLWLGVGGSDVSFTMTGGSITMGSKNPQFSPKEYAKSRFTMTGGAFNANGRNVLTGYQTSYATNIFDVFYSFFLKK